METTEALEVLFAPMNIVAVVGAPEGAKAAWFREFDPRTAEGSAKRQKAWGDGPWRGEPDRLEWRSHGMPCLVLRSHNGGLCGYVGVPPSHALHGTPFQDVDVSCHGGLSYASACAHGICHVPNPGEHDAVWWLGFDCVHVGDLTPAVQLAYQNWLAPGEQPPPIESTGLATECDDDGELSREVYRALPYVVAEVERLAAQLAEAA